MPRAAVQTETLVSLSPIGISPKPETFSITNSLPPGTGNPAVASASPGASWTATAIWNACLAGLSASRMLTPGARATVGVLAMFTSGVFATFTPGVLEMPTFQVPL